MNEDPEALLDELRELEPALVQHRTDSRRIVQQIAATYLISASGAFVQNYDRAGERKPLYAELDRVNRESWPLRSRAKEIKRLLKLHKPED